MKVLSTASARPNFVKLAAVHHAFVAHSGFEHVIVHTGQHYDPLFSDIFFEQLSIPMPAHNLGVKGGGDRESVIAATATAILPILEKEKPDIVLVYGDVNGAVGAARAANELSIHIGHIESGLRSFDLTMPEEHNRIEIDRLADHLFVTEQSGVDHLQKEGAGGKVHFVGNTMIDTLVRMLPLVRTSPLPQGLPKAYAIATLHRPSNVDSPASLKKSLEFLGEVSTYCPLVFPLHRRTQAAIEAAGLKDLIPSTITLIDPLGYIEFLALVSHAAFVLTDSGGIQEEATFLGKKCFTLRKNTERPSTVRSGSNTLIDLDDIGDQNTVLSFAKKPRDPTVLIPSLWDGKAGERIAEVLASL